MADQSNNFFQQLAQMMSEMAINFAGGYTSKDPQWGAKRMKLQKDLQDAEEDKKLKKMRLDLLMGEHEMAKKKLALEEQKFEQSQKSPELVSETEQKPLTEYVPGEGMAPTRPGATEEVPVKGKYDWAATVGKNPPHQLDTIAKMKALLTPPEAKPPGIHQLKSGEPYAETTSQGTVVKTAPGQAETKPLSDIGKLYADRGMLLDKGLPPDHSVIRAIDSEIVKKSSPTEKSQSEEELTRIALFDPDPIKKSQAAQILNQMQARKIQIGAAQAGANETAKMNADKTEAMTIIKQSNLVDRLLSGKTAPADISQSFRQPWVRILAVGMAMEKDPNYNEIQADANKQWYSTSTTQRLIRRTESIVAPGGAADEAMRVAKLVDNPAGTPINKIKGKIQVAFGNSQRALLNLVQGISSEEIQQIMGAQGGGERFLEFTQGLNDPNLSVQQYINNVKELKYLILTRQLANTRGTPEQKTWEKFAEETKKERPFAPKTEVPNKGVIQGKGWKATPIE